jgi:hypothetical protein
MIPLYMPVMLTERKQIAKNGFKKKKPLFFLAVFQKTRILKCLSFGLVWLFHSELVRFFQLELGRSFQSDLVRFFLDLIGYFFRIGYIKSIAAGLFLKAREHSILS